LILDEIKSLEIEQQDVVAHQKSMKKYLDSLGMLVQLKKNYACKDAIMQKRCVVESSEKRYKIQEVDLQCILQRLEWKLCREISSLQCKFEVRLEKIGGDDDDRELISILFIGKRQSTKLRVFFTIYESYPNVPLDIHIQTLIGGDKLDTDALQRFLQNSVSPGFSYATRLGTMFRRRTI
jgi:hypothetical protein